MHTKWGAVFVLLLSSLAPVETRAAPGDLARDFGGFGSDGRIRSLGRIFASAIALDAQGRLVLAGTVDETFFVQRRSGGRFLTIEEVTIVIDAAQERAGATSLAIAPDGKIVVAGSVTIGTDRDFAIARLNLDLTLDTTFAGDGTASLDFGGKDDFAAGVAVQADRKVVAVGAADVTDDYDENKKAAVRLSEDGTPDAGFDGDGKWTFGDDFGNAVAIQDDGKILIASGGDDFVVTRLNGDGTRDGSFDEDGVAAIGLGKSFEYANGIAIAPGGGIVVAGYVLGNIAGVARLLPTGAADDTFDGDGWRTFGDTGEAYAVAVQPDGKVIIASGFYAGGSPARFEFALARFNGDGALDTTFGEGGLVRTPFAASTFVRALALQPDGMVIAAGGAQAARYRGDGSLDAGGIATLFFHPRHLGSEANALRVAADGGLVAAGRNFVGDSYDVAVARYLPDYRQGLNPGFGSDTPQSGRTHYGFGGQQEQVLALALEPDGGVVFAGEFLGMDTRGYNLMVGRLKATGSADAECLDGEDFGSGNDQAAGVAVGPDGRLYAAGTVLGPNGSFDFGIVRFTAACRIEGFPFTYKVRFDLGGDDIVGGMVLQDGGRVVAAGASGNDIVLIRTRVTRFGDVVLDTGFGAGGRAVLDTGYAERAAAAVAQPDGKILVAGTVDRGGTSDFLLARFTADGILDPDFGNNGVAFADFNPTDDARAVDVRGDGTIAVAGNTVTPAGVVVAVAQFTPDGEPDAAFDQGGRTTLRLGSIEEDVAHAVAFVGRDRLFVGGYAVVTAFRQFALAALETTPDFTVPTTTTSTTLTSGSTTSTIPNGTFGTTTTVPGGTFGTTTSTIPGGATERCGNCADDDGNGLTDFEDPACCPAPAGMTVGKAAIAPVAAGTKLKLSATLAESLLAAASSPTQDVFLQISQSGSALLCAQLPAESLVRRKRVLRFEDERNAVPTAAGISKLRLHAKKNGRGVLKVIGRETSLAIPTSETVRVSLGLRDEATAEAGNRCARADVALQAGKKGALRFP